MVEVARFKSLSFKLTELCYFEVLEKRGDSAENITFPTLLKFSDKRWMTVNTMVEYQTEAFAVRIRQI